MPDPAKADNKSLPGGFLLEAVFFQVFLGKNYAVKVQDIFLFFPFRCRKITASGGILSEHRAASA